jgi:hypothetical protein
MFKVSTARTFRMGADGTVTFDTSFLNRSGTQFDHVFNGPDSPDPILAEDFASNTSRHEIVSFVSSFPARILAFADYEPPCGRCSPETGQEPGPAAQFGRRQRPRRFGKRILPNPSSMIAHFVHMATIIRNTRNFQC